MVTNQRVTNGRMNSVAKAATVEGGNLVNTNTSTGTHRAAAVIVGVLFILASVSAVLGLLFYGPILNGSDYLTNSPENSTQVTLGALMELVLAVTAIGTAVCLFPVLRPYGERIALGHLCFRFFEAI